MIRDWSPVAGPELTLNPGDANAVFIFCPPIRTYISSRCHQPALSEQIHDPVTRAG